jgi:hypothetical protein
MTRHRHDFGRIGPSGNAVNFLVQLSFKRRTNLFHIVSTRQKRAIVLSGQAIAVSIQD